MYGVLGLPLTASYAMILGRLFKFHPTFDVVLADILIGLGENQYVLLIAEKVFDINDTIFNRIKDLLARCVDCSIFATLKTIANDWSLF
jgi:hypothetical protein